MGFPETSANRLIDRYVKSISDLLYLEELAFEIGALVNYRRLFGSEAWLTYVGSKPGIITISTAIESSERKRFSIAHELGHFEMHKSASFLKKCSRSDISHFHSLDEKINLEDEANSFASSLLLPSKFLLPIVDKDDLTLQVLRETSDLFSTSLTATARRLIDITSEPYAVVWCENGVIRWFKMNKSFSDLDVFLRVKERIDSRSSAAVMINDPSADIGSRWRKVRIDAWLRENKFQPGATIKEQSIGLPNFNAALSLLWIDDPIFDDELW